MNRRVGMNSFVAVILLSAVATTAVADANSAQHALIKKGKEQMEKQAERSAQVPGTAGVQHQTGLFNNHIFSAERILITPLSMDTLGLSTDGGKTYIKTFTRIQAQQRILPVLSGSMKLSLKTGSPMRLSHQKNQNEKTSNEMDFSA